MNKSDLDITIIPFEEYRECMLCSDSRKESGLNVPHSVDISEKFCKKIQDGVQGAVYVLTECKSRHEQLCPFEG